MPLTQIQFESDFEPHSVIGEWWKHYGMGGGTKLPHPLVSTECSPCGGYEDDLWVNLELWRKPDSKQTIGRLSARSEPFGSAAVTAVLQRVADSLQPKPGRPLPASALAEDSFTWVGGWDWTTEDSDPGHWGMAKLDDILATAPRGLCASDGTLICDASKTCRFGIVDAAHRAIYFGYDFLGLNADALEIEVIAGCGSMPIDAISGVHVLKKRTEVYSAAISADGAELAILEYSSKTEYGRGYISLIDTVTGVEHALTWFEHASGSEQISFSPDDRWLLVPRSGNDYGALIIDAATGAQHSFDTLNHATCWWVRDGRLGLLCIGTGSEATGDYDPYRVTFFDLTSGDTSFVVQIEPPNDSHGLPYRSLWTAEPHADGRILLSMPVPPANENYQIHTVLGMFDLDTGHLAPVMEPFADSTKYILRKQTSWHWNSPLSLRPTMPCTLLEEGLTTVDVSVWPEPDEYEYGAVIRVDMNSPFMSGR
jgi:hypothetical protein